MVVHRIRTGNDSFVTAIITDCDCLHGSVPSPGRLPTRRAGFCTVRANHPVQIVRYELREIPAPCCS